MKKNNYNLDNKKKKVILNTMFKKNSDKDEHIRNLLLFFFRKGEDELTTAEKICKVYGDDAVNEKTARKWFKKFCAGDFNLVDTKQLESETEASNSNKTEDNQISLSTTTISKKLKQEHLETTKEK